MTGYTGSTPDTEPARAWQSDAACRAPGVDPEAFYPKNTVDSIDAARAICVACPVRQECLVDCMRAEGGRSAKSRFGVFAGLSPRQRAALYYRLRDARRKATAV
jgi:hypothetical protein